MTRSRRRHVFAPVLGVCAGLLVSSALPAADMPGAGPPAAAGHGTAAVGRHITLDASIPADEQAVSGEVSEIRLFFSDAPLMRGASIRVVNSARRLQRSGPPQADPDDPRQLWVETAEPLPPGTYVVQWRCIADDGHVMRGDFTFDVADP